MSSQAFGPHVLPIAVIGAGPVGLTAAAQLLQRGLEPLILEAGPTVATSVREWGHVRLFSPWRYLVDDSARGLLEASGWRGPDPLSHPTGAELVRDFLEPLAALPQIAASLRLCRRVTAVTRAGFDRMKTVGRDQAPFLVVTQGRHGEERFLVRAVIDASGTWATPNPLGAGGVMATGEAALAGEIRYGIPDARGAERSRYAGKRALVVGSGHSALNAVLDLAALRKEAGAGAVVWAVRRSEAQQMFGGGEDDGLPERAALGRRARAAVDGGEVDLVTGFHVERLEKRGQALRVFARDGRSLDAEELVAATGFRPELAPLRELRLELDPITEAPARLAPLIDPNVHSCGTVPPHGEAELSHPDTGFYLVGMKSYGRAPTFLLLTGYEQVRSVVAFISGDVAAARRVELTLPETGVCCDDGCCDVLPASASAGGSLSIAVLDELPVTR